MTMPRQPAAPFASALIVSANEGHAKIDRDFLKRCRVSSLRTTASGTEALASLRRERAQLVVCDAALADMDGQAFVSALRADPALAGIPVIMAAVASTRADVLRAVKLGVAGYCIRPYSQDTFQRHLSMAARLAAFGATKRAALARAEAAQAQGRDAAAASGYAALADAPDAAPRLFEEGMVALAAADYDRAIAAFHRALAVSSLFVEAYLGLARAWKAKGSLNRYRHFLKQAASACARARRFAELRDRFVELLAGDDTRFNPFLALGNELLRDRHYTAAATLYRHARELAPDNPDIALGLAKAYHFLRRPDLARRAVDKALSLDADSAEGRLLYHRLTGRRHGDIPPLEERAPATDAPPYPWVLRGVLYVAGLAADRLLRPRRLARAA